MKNKMEKFIITVVKGFAFTAGFITAFVKEIAKFFVQVIKKAFKIK